MKEPSLEKAHRTVPTRYAEIDTRNTESDYMMGKAGFRVTLSVNGFGRPREPLNRFSDQSEFVEAAMRVNKERRINIAGGNMSVATDPKTGDQLYGNDAEASSDERLAHTTANLHRHLEQLGIDSERIVGLNPQRGNQAEVGILAVNVDDAELELDAAGMKKVGERADFIYTYDPETVLAIKPADCPLFLMSGETPKGKVRMVMHFSWESAANKGIDHTLTILDQLQVDRSTLEVYITPGGQAETYPHNLSEHPHQKYPGTEDLFIDPKENGEKYSFGIDTPNFVYKELIEKSGIDPKQVFLDTSDTTAPESGYSSHSRAVRYGEPNTRDLVLMEDAPRYAEGIKVNPNNPAPVEILEQIASVPVKYIDFEGNEQRGVVEIHETMVPFVKAFFEKALELKFPIAHVARSSDPEFAWSDDKLMAANASSGFNYRLIKGTNRPSKHGFGFALDINDALNPYIRYKADGTTDVDPPGATYDPSLPGTLTAEHPLVLLVKEYGMEWGGDWVPDPATGEGRTDYQHIEAPDDFPALVNLKNQFQ